MEPVLGYWRRVYHVNDVSRNGLEFAICSKMKGNDTAYGHTDVAWVFMMGLEISILHIHSSLCFGCYHGCTIRYQ